MCLENDIRSLSVTSDENCVCNGIRQGGVISPLLFCIYMDELLKRLEAEGVGCWIGKHYYGDVGYAYDLTLAVPSVRGLRQMLKICEEFGEEYSVEYNPTKTVCVLFSRQKIVHKSDIQLCGSTLKWVDHVKHLGNHLESNLSEILFYFNTLFHYYELYFIVM